MNCIDTIDTLHQYNNEGEIVVALYEHDISHILPTMQDAMGFILICHSGRARFDYAHTCYDISSRDIIIVSPGDIYTLKDISADFSCSWVGYTASALQKINRDFPAHFFKMIASYPYHNLADNEQYSNRMEYLKLLFDKQEEKENSYRYSIMESILRAMLLEILAGLASVAKKDKKGVEYRSQVVDDFICAVKRQPQHREVAYFASTLGVSAKYLSTLVLDATGQSAKEFIDNNAIAYIKQLLRTTNLSVIQIAQTLAYSGDSNLCRFFKSRTGMTILEYKNSL